MRKFQWPRRAIAKQESQIQSSSFYGMWDTISRFAAEIRASDFMSDMIRRRDAYGSEGAMGAIDCATLYGLTRWLRDRKSTRLNSSHSQISYAVFCLKKKK